ncbi:CBS domain-containing protein [Leptolyngbya cf. ectocarpi LEGE 11479]|uniref:histidine kinase n=1 Tax=Leptolyngbya cf. ectocarpi LEGE 11479 TaxID=1828722 RepID=A0A928ZTY9_LEPEC|nr:CBS domain-containing protein [Leptolyngbya ectocarpi]MBE9067407.1 CBS domain-containing protein [Leptolyngbya cf. ectocarpi LEGE 11479]
MLADSPSPNSLTLINRAIISTPLTVTADALLGDAIAQMHQAKSSYILSTDQQRPVGIFTERDLVRLLASGQSTIGMTLATVMTQELLTLAAEDIKDVFEILHLMKKNRVRHLPVVDELGKLTGVITRQSLREALPPSSLLKFRLVKEVMESKVVCAPQATSLLTLVQQMAEHRVSCIVIADSNHRPVGIVTERDIVQFQTLGTNFSQTQAQTVMSSPLLPIQPHDSLWMAHQQMTQNHVRRLVVCMPDKTLAGLITQSSLLKTLDPNEIQQVVELLQQEVEQLRSENQTLIEDRTCELENQLRLSQQLEQSHSRLTATNVTLTTTLQALQIAQQNLRQANADLENQVETRTADLRQAEHRWRTLLENVPLVVVGLDHDGKVTYVNPFLLELTGYTASQVLGKDWFEQFVPSFEQPRLTQYFQQLLTQSDTAIQYQNIIVTRSGEKRMIAWNNTLLCDGNDTILGSMSIGEDITERLVIDRMKSEFIDIVGHELRTPLTSIDGGLKLITGGLVASDSEQGQLLLQTVAKSSQRLVRLVEEILDFECLESGKSLLTKESLNTQDLTHPATAAVQPMAKRSGIALKVSDPGFELVADRQRIQQVLTNLLDNAIKFSPDGSTIWLTVDTSLLSQPDHTESMVRFQVRDQGPGILPEQCKTIFDRFMQLDSSDTRSNGGTGLGLAICRKIIEQHSGNIWVESTLGEGSCFYFTLPKG